MTRFGTRFWVAIDFGCFPAKSATIRRIFMRGLIMALFAGQISGQPAGCARAHARMTKTTAKTTTKTV
jgi:hypothetical protein